MINSEGNGNWAIQKEKLKQKFAVLTDKDFLVNQNQNEELYKKLQLALGLSREELMKIFAAL